MSDELMRSAVAGGDPVLGPGTPTPPPPVEPSDAERLAYERDCYRAVLEGAGYELIDVMPSRGIEFCRAIGAKARERTLELRLSSCAGVVAQGPCETTLTPRFQIKDCACGTYEGNLGPCLTWNEGNAVGRCVFCDHGLDCHVKLSRLLVSEKPQADPKNTNSGNSRPTIAELDAILARDDCGSNPQELSMKVNDELMNRLVDAFLAWPLPHTVCSDLCATKQGYPNRTGTNLLTADEARQMLKHVIQFIPSAIATGKNDG